MKKGITLISILATVAIIGILTTTVTLSAFKVSNDSKKLKFATEISYIIEAINSYYTTNQSFPIGESMTVDLTQLSEKSISQFANEEGYSEKNIILYQIDKTKLGISDTIYGNGDTINKDIYAVSKETKNVYYINGVSVSNITYYTLTEDLKKLVSYNLSMNVQKEPTMLKSTVLEASSSSAFLGIGVRSNITKVIFEDTKKNAPANVTDVSATSDESIIAWLDGTEVHIASNGEIYAHADSTYLFANMERLAEIENLKLLNTSRTTNMRAMFYNCKLLKKIDLSNFNVDILTNMHDMFQGCIALKSLDLSTFNTSNVTNMLWTFYNCYNLETIYVSDKFTTNNVLKQNSDNMFYNCTKLVGGKGTKYNSSYVDKTYAKADKMSSPGYFTQNLAIIIGEKQSLISSDEQERYLFVTVNLISDSDIKTVKFEREIMSEEDALIYFKNNGIELQEDIIEVKEETKGVTVYLEDITGKVTVVSKAF